MDIALLKKHISIYKQNLGKDPAKHARDLAERKQRIDYYQSWTKELILSILIKRWDGFLKNVKGFGPATISEILCHVYPDKCMLWNRRAYVGLNYLGIEGLPRYNYQMTGKKYWDLSGEAQKIAEEKGAGSP